MIQTYKGILHGNRIVWSADGGPNPDQPVPVEVTVVDSLSAVDQAERGRKMALALERLAVAGTFDSITDPVEWQRDQRVDRALPGRE